MALPKLFQRIFWHNNTTPAINEDNLNAMSKAIDDIDNRVIVLGDDVITVIPQIQAYLEQAEDLVEAMELLSQNPPYIGQNGNWWVWDTNTSTFVDSGVDASISVNIADITMLAPNATPYVTNSGTDTDPIFHLFIPRGQTGNGISTIAKTGTSGLVDTYTITMTDGTTSTFTVTNGSGDMNKSVYDPTNAIANAGGMKSAAAKNSTNAVTANSTDLVESGAVYARTEPLWDNMMDNGAVNNCKCTETTKTTTDGTTTFTWTVNNDKTVTVSAPSYPVTLESAQYIEYWKNISADECSKFVGKEVKVTGCPSGGSDSRYRIYIYRAGSADGSANSYNDYGDGVSFTWLNNGTGTKVTVYCELKSGFTMTAPLTFKPMLSDPALNLSYDDYVPYAKSNRELTEDVAVRSLTVSDYFEMKTGFTLTHQILKKVGNGYSLQGAIQGTYVVGRTAVATMTSVLGTATEENLFGGARLLDANSTYHPATVGLAMKANGELSVYSDTAGTSVYVTFSLFIPF